MFRLSVLYFVFGGFIGAFSPYLSIYLNSIDYQPWQIGVVTSILMASRIISPYALGWLADKFHEPTSVITVAYIANMLLSFSLLFPLSFYSFTILIVLMSFFWGGLMPLLDWI